VAIVLTNYDQLRLIDWPLLLVGRSPAMGTLGGTFLFWIGTGFFGILSQPLARKFGTSDNPVVQLSLGRPRMLAGALSALSLLPILRDAIAEGNAPLTAIFVAYLAGEALIAVSSPDHA
jgi:hypothetical protein